MVPGYRPGLPPLRGYRGLSPEQTSLMELGRRECPAGHRFNGGNFPTPEGDCPRCTDPNVAAQIFDFEWQVATLEADAKNARLSSPAYGTHIQEPPLVLTAGRN